mgnify:CR=1 FL=1
MPLLQMMNALSVISNRNLTGMGGAGFNEAMALRWLGNEVDFMSMVARSMSKSQIDAFLKTNDVNMSTDYVLPMLDGMPTSVILYCRGKKQTFEDVKDSRHVDYDFTVFTISLVFTGLYSRKLLSSLV